MLDSFILFHEYKKYFEALPPDKCKELLLALFHYSEHGEPPSFSDIAVELASFAIIDSIKRTKDKYAQTVEKNRENGAKGGRPKKNPLDSQENLNNPTVIPETQANPSEANESICNSNSNSNCFSDSKEIKDTYVPSGTTPTNTDFETFWKAYPNKKAKQAALKAWTKNKKALPGIDNLIAILERHKQSKDWTKDGGAYIPHPATWLNRGQWEDEMEKAQQQNQRPEWMKGLGEVI